ncbi:hypothetical protein DWG20_00240 [Crenobacter cavernae]|uniref:Uncharacterized protein n=2 Tax=Crenobacter cavernae TaxID=2290923 RepID=A0A345Y231_9NEIS|nr:hypothetical protein DWG20_00240 [Crenobacter cavernae]
MAILSFILTLSGCSDKPSDTQTKQDSIDYALANIVVDKSFLELTKAERTNGWEKDKAYFVHYDLEFKTTENYATMLTAKAENIEAQLAALSELEQATYLMKLSLEYNDKTYLQPFTDWWKGNQDTAEYQQTVGRFLRKTSNNDMRERQLMLVAAYAELTSNGSFPVGMKKGDTYKYWTELSYIKTEKGWMRQQ